MVLVLMLNLPGRQRALVSPETARMMVEFGHAKLLEDDREQQPPGAWPAQRHPHG